MVYDLARNVILAGIYFAAATFGLSLALEHSSATLVWPGTGLALSALLVFGYRLWPGILLGAFAANLSNQEELLTSLAIAVGNTLEALAGVWLVNRFAGGAAFYQRASNVLRFVLLGGVFAAAISATVGVASLALSG